MPLSNSTASRPFSDGAVYVLTEGANGKLLKVTPKSATSSRERRLRRRANHVAGHGASPA